MCIVITLMFLVFILCDNASLRHVDNPCWISVHSWWSLFFSKSSRDWEFLKAMMSTLRKIFGILKWAQIFKNGEMWFSWLPLVILLTYFGHSSSWRRKSFGRWMWVRCKSHRRSRIEECEKNIWKYGMTLLYSVEFGAKQWGIYWKSNNVRRK